MCVWVAEGPRLRSAQENPKSGIAGSDHGSGAFGASVLAELFPYSWLFFFAAFPAAVPGGSAVAPMYRVARSQPPDAPRRSWVVCGAGGGKVLSPLPNLAPSLSGKLLQVAPGDSFGKQF